VNRSASMVTSVSEDGALTASVRSSLRAGNLSDRTVDTYMASVEHEFWYGTALWVLRSLAEGG
jgi:hypothetical protein